MSNFVRVSPKFFPPVLRKFPIMRKLRVKAFEKKKTSVLRISCIIEMFWPRNVNFITRCCVTNYRAEISL